MVSKTHALLLVRFLRSGQTSCPLSKEWPVESNLQNIPCFQKSCDSSILSILTLDALHSCYLYVLVLSVLILKVFEQISLFTWRRMTIVPLSRLAQQLQNNYFYFCPSFQDEWDSLTLGHILKFSVEWSNHLKRHKTCTTFCCLWQHSPNRYSTHFKACLLFQTMLQSGLFSIRILGIVKSLRHLLSVLAVSSHVGVKTGQRVELVVVRQPWKLLLCQQIRQVNYYRITYTFLWYFL